MVNVKEIGEAVGYNDSNYFAKVFKRVTGISPTEYRISIFNRK
ncbi:MAG: AraC family transcriptional regulator [Clostridiales bacterium]|nr:AraC family transcriptional regulator [Clostridiales bacterium]